MMNEIMAKFKKLKQERDKAWEVTENPEDKVLTSLRRRRQIQLNEMEKAKLKKQIHEYNRNKSRKELWGFVDNKPRKKVLYGRKQSLLNDKRPLLKEKNRLVK